MSEVKLSNRAVPTVNVDALVIGIGKDGDGVRVEGVGLPAALRHDIKVLAPSLGLTGQLGQVIRVPAGTDLKADVLVLTGLGSRTTGSDDGTESADGAVHYPAENLRQATGAALRSLAGTKSVAIALPTPSQAALGAVVEGAILGNYAFTKYQNDADHKAAVPSIEIVTRLSRSSWAQDEAKRAELVARAQNTVRDLVNTPSNHLHPGTLTEFVKSELKKYGLRTLKFTDLDLKALRAGGYGGLVSVGQGSAHGPHLVKVAYTPTVPTSAPRVGLVGKGITFDTGGISLKPPAGMDIMTCDMAGAASVFAAVVVAARLELPIPVTAYLCLAENMPSSTATRPGDIVEMRNGKTVKINNTDAEGRLVMADGLASAIEDGCGVVVDIATLTRTQSVALGSRTAAVFGTDEIRDELVAAAKRAGEPAWPMPIPDELAAAAKSDHADLVNVSGLKVGGALFAAAFLREFVGEVPWGHLDIFGPAYNESAAYGYTPKGGTGAGVRTLVEFLEERAKRG